MNLFINQCFSILDSNYKLERVIIQDPQINMYRIIDNYYVVIIEEEIEKNYILKILSNIEKIYKSYLMDEMYVLIIGSTVDFIKSKDCLYCYDLNCFVNLFLLDEKNNKIITDATANFGGPDFRPIIKKLIKTIDL